MISKIASFSLLFIIGAFITSCQEDAPKTNFTIKGKVTDEEEGKLYFMHQSTDGNPLVDTVEIKKGEFSFRGFVQEPTPFYLSSSLLRNNNKPPVLIFIESGDMEMELSVDQMENVKLSNSKSNDAYVEYKIADQVYKNQVDSIYNQAMQHKDDPKMQKALEAKMYIVDSMESDLISRFVEEHKNSVVSAYLISGKFLSRGEFGRARELFDGLDLKVKKSNIGNQVNEVLAKAALTEPGAEAPVFSQQDADGKMVSLRDFRGKYVLVDFWASWCSPCRQENPIVRQIYDKYQKDNFEIIGISLDKDRSQWLKAIKEDNLQWTQLSDLNGWDNEVSKTYGVQSIPENFLLDPKGRIVAKSLRGEQLDQKLAEIFGH